MKTLPIINSSEEGGGEAQTSLNFLYRRHWRELCLYVENAFGMGPPEPEEVVQTAFLRYASLADRSAVRNPSAFLYSTVRNIVLDHRRHDRVKRGYAEEYRHTRDDRAVTGITPERVLLGRERLNQLIEFLNGMPEQRRRVVVLSRVEKLSAQEIAARFGIMVNTVRKQLERAITDCLEHLEESDAEGKADKELEK